MGDLHYFPIFFCQLKSRYQTIDVSSKETLSVFSIFPDFFLSQGKKINSDFVWRHLRRLSLQTDTKWVDILFTRY